METVYIENEVAGHPRVEEILNKYPNANRVYIERHGEVFNSHAQNFRLQKQSPSLILARKHNKRVLPAPQQYETGGGANYYFSHMLNCLYDCRYCFLQGMYRSANYLLFVNYEDFIDDIEMTANRHIKDAKKPWFFSGYDCDSLALEPLTKFSEFFLKAFNDLPQAVLELRTKSTQIRALLAREAMSNVVVAFSLSPSPVAKSVEKGAPGIDKRIEALQKLQRAGWRIGLRFDPVIWHANYQESYLKLIEAVFNALDPANIDSVTVGGFRLPKGYYKTMSRLYPEHWLFSAGLQQAGGMVAYHEDIESEMFMFLKAEIESRIAKERTFFYCTNEN